MGKAVNVKRNTPKTPTDLGEMLLKKKPPVQNTGGFNKRNINSSSIQHLDPIK